MSSHRDLIRAVVDKAPPLTRDQRDQLAGILAPVLAKRNAGRKPRGRGSRAA
jgi:hypothetical protein